jgi:hypothetical protein
VVALGDLQNAILDGTTVDTQDLGWGAVRSLERLLVQLLPQMGIGHAASHCTHPSEPINV